MPPYCASQTKATLTDPRRLPPGPSPARRRAAFPAVAAPRPNAASATAAAAARRARDPPRLEPGEKGEPAEQDRRPDDEPACGIEQGRRPAGADREHDGRGHARALRRQQRDREPEHEERGEDERPHLELHARVERRWTS